MKPVKEAVPEWEEGIICVLGVLTILLHWKGAFQMGWLTNSTVRIEENGGWVLSEFGEDVFPVMQTWEFSNKGLAWLDTLLHPCMYVSYREALRKHWDRDLRKCALGDLTAAKCTGFTLLVVPGRAAQVVYGVGLEAKSALLLGPALEPARCWSLSHRTPELQALCWLRHWRSPV